MQNIVVSEETKGNMGQVGIAIGLISVELSTLLLVEDIQSFAGCVLADGIDFLQGGSAVYLEVRKGFVAGTILLHYVNHRFR